MLTGTIAQTDEKEADDLKKIFWLIVGIPIAILLVLFSVANRQIVSVALFPIDTGGSRFMLEFPLFVFLFLALLLGVLVGGVVVWFSQGAYRRTARREKGRADELARQIKTDRPSLPPVRRDEAA